MALIPGSTGPARDSSSEGSDGVFLLARNLGRVPKELRPRVRSALKASGTSIRARAAQEASWSSRIPAAMKVRARFTGSRPGVYVYVSRKAAPHARPLEGITGNRSFRHPLGWNQDVWVNQDTRPFLAPAVNAGGGQAIHDLQDALDSAVTAAGFG